jgi:hypothetical protein
MNSRGLGMYMMGKLFLLIVETELKLICRWYIRHTEWLEETDRTGAMTGSHWRLQSLGPGGM